MADGKDLGEADRAGQELGRVTAGEGVLVVLFRIVLITPTSGGGEFPHLMVGDLSKLRVESGRSGGNFPGRSCLL